MKFELKQQFRVESARRLPRLPESHPCSRIHGNSFLITLVLQGELSPQLEWLMDYNEIKVRAQEILKEIDHRLLNEIVGLENPTTENLTAWIYYKLQKSLPLLKQVRVSETPDTECSFPV